MCNQLLQHAKVIPNDQSVQPDLAYFFLSFHCITFIYFFLLKNWSPHFISKDFILTHSGFFNIFSKIWTESATTPPPLKDFVYL